VATDLNWQLAAQCDSPGGLYEFRPVMLWQRQADTTSAGSLCCDVGLEGLSP